MKELLNMAKCSINDEDGFLNGFFKGAFGSACIFVVVTVWCGYIG